MKSVLKTAPAVVIIAGPLCLFGVQMAYAGSCPGTVYQLSDTYNQAKGSGFLAVRTGPGTSNRKIGELFNGDQVEVDRRRGNWIYIYADTVDGWVYQKYVDRGCDGI